MEGLKQEVIKLWDPSSPFASIFSLLSYAIPFVPGLGWGVFALEKIASFLGLGLKNLGEWIDRECNLGSSSGASDMASCVGKLLTNLVKQKQASMSEDELRKQAFWGMALTRLIPVAVRLLGKAIGTIFLAVGANNIGEMNEIVEQAKGIATEKAKEHITPEMVSEYMTPEMLMGLLTQQEQ